MSSIAIISEAAVLKHVSRKMAYDAVRKAFLAVVAGESKLFPVVIGAGEHKDSMVAIKSGFLADGALVGLKVGTYWPENQTTLNKPNHGSTTLLLDPASGFPMALVNASKLNGLRTAAADAVATNMLANPEAKVLLIVGTGHQAAFELRAVCDVRSFESVLVWGRDPNKAQAFIASIGEYASLCSVAENLEAATRSADVIVTVTTSTKPLIEASWVRPGTHISAMGADKVGKQELSPDLLLKAQRFADNPKQSVGIGEMQHLTADLPITAIGAVLNDTSPFKFDPEGITVFDSSGVALQDIACAAQLHQHLLQSSELQVVDF